MISDKDEGRGTCRLFWKHIRDRTAEFDPELCRLVDKLDPSEKFPLFLSYYPYGELIADQHDVYFPMLNGDMLSLRDKNIPKIMVKELGYGMNDLPLGMGFSRHAEIFTYLTYSRKSLFSGYFGPGSWFPFHRIMDREIKHSARPNNSVYIHSGARTLFTLPGMGALDHFEQLINAFGIRAQIPRHYSQQYDVFKEIFEDQAKEAPWMCGLVFFAEPWDKCLRQDVAWRELSQYLRNKRLDGLDYLRNKDEYSLAFNEVLTSVNEKPNAFFIDLMKHVIEIAAGQVAGFAPVIDENFCPRALLLRALTEVYEPRRFPTLMVPAYYQAENRQSVYASLEALWHTSLAPNSFPSASNLNSLKKFLRLVCVVQEAFHQKSTMAYDTLFGEIIRKLDLAYFHGSVTSDPLIHSASELIHLDPRFMQAPASLNLSEDLIFPDSSPFFKGCIQISTK